MTLRTYSRVALVLSVAGLLFSGYLSGTKLISGSCAFNEPCPIFLGYPACWYGFAMFLVMTVASIALVARGAKELWPARWNSIVSFVGILFAGRFVVPETAKLVSGTGGTYSLGLPTCTYGLVFFIAIFVTSVWLIRSESI